MSLGLLQSEVAVMLGANETSIYNWENNRTRPHTKLMPAIIEFLGYLPFGDMPSMTLGERIAVYRYSLGISQEQLARRLGVDPGTVSRWEKGKGMPDRDLLKTIGEFSGVGAQLPSAGLRSAVEGG